MCNITAGMLFEALKVYFHVYIHYITGVLQKHKWENCMTLDKGSWGYRRNSRAEDYVTMEDLTEELVTTVR